jgi:hypothetical protein
MTINNQDPMDLNTTGELNREFSGVGGMDAGQRPDVVSEDFKSVGPVEARGSRLRDVYDTFARSMESSDAYRATTEYFLQEAHNRNSAVPNDVDGLMAGIYPDFFVKGKPPSLEQILQKLTNFEDPSFTELAAQKIPKALLTAAGTAGSLAAGVATAPLTGPAIATGVVLTGIGGTMFAADAASDWLSGIGITPEQTKVLNPTKNYLDEGLNTFFENLSIGLPVSGAIKSRLSGVDYSLFEKQVGANKIKESVDNLFRKGASFLGKGVEDYGPKTLAGIEAALSVATGAARGRAELDFPGSTAAGLVYELGAGFTPVVSVPKAMISIYQNKNLAPELGRTRAGQMIINLVENAGQDPEVLKRALLEASNPESFRTLPDGDQVPYGETRSVVESTIPGGVDEFGEPFEESQPIAVLIQNLRLMNKNFDNLFEEASNEERLHLMGLMNRVVSTWSDNAIEGAPNVFLEAHNIRYGGIVDKYQNDIQEIIKNSSEANERISSQQKINSDGTLDQVSSAELRKEGSLVLVKNLEEGLSAARRKEKSFYDLIPDNETFTPLSLVETLISIRDGKLKGLRTKSTKAKRSIPDSDEELINALLFDPKEFLEYPKGSGISGFKEDLPIINILDPEKKISDEQLLANIKTMPFDEALNLRSYLLSEARSRFAETGDDVTASIYSDLARALDEDITGRAKGILSLQDETGEITEAQQAIVSAWENSKALNDTWSRTFAGSLIETNKKGGRSIPPELALSRLAAGSSDASNLRVSQVRAAVRAVGLELDKNGNPLSQAGNVKAAERRGQEVDNQIGVMYRQIAQKVIKADGTVDKKALVDFFETYDELLNQVPQLQSLKSSLMDADQANDLLIAYSKTIGKTPKQILALKNSGEEAVGEFVKNIARQDLWAGELGIDPKDVFTYLSSAKDPVKTFRELAEWSASQGGDVAEGFKQIVLERAFSELEGVNQFDELSGNIFAFSKIMLGPMHGIKNQPSYLRVMQDAGLIDTEYVINFKKLVKALEIQARMDKKPSFERQLIKDSQEVLTEEASKPGYTKRITETVKGALSGILGSEAVSSIASKIGLPSRGLIIPAAGAKIGREVAGTDANLLSIPGFSRQFILEALEPGNELVLARLIETGKQKGLYKVDADGNYIPKSKGQQAITNAEDRKFLTAFNKMVQSFLPRALTPAAQKILSAERYLEDTRSSEDRLTEGERESIRSMQELDSGKSYEDYFREETEKNRQRSREKLEKARENYRKNPLLSSSTQPNPASSLSQVSPFQNAPASPQQRAQYADVFPNDITSNIIRSRSRGGIGSLV